MALIRNTKDLGGVFAAIAIPFDGNMQQSVNYEKLEHNIAKWEMIPMSGYCIGGSYGEWRYLTNSERIKILKAVKSSVHRSKFIMAGTMCESTRQCIDLSLAEAEAGADAILLQTPHYFRLGMNQNAIVRTFHSRRRRYSDTRGDLYNPATTGIDISIDTIEILANHPNIAGVEDANVFKLGAIVERTKDKEFQVLASSAGDLLPALLVGCSGGTSGLANILGDQICEMYSLALANKWLEAAEIQRRLVLPDFLLFKQYEPNALKALKAAMDMLGYYGGHCRKPLIPLEDEDIPKIRKVLQESGQLDDAES